jgi:hypothetical protein
LELLGYKLINKRRSFCFALFLYVDNAPGITNVCNK